MCRSLVGHVRAALLGDQLPIFLKDIQVHLKSRQHLFGIRRISPVGAQTLHPLSLIFNVALSLCNAPVGFSQIVILGWHGLGPLSSSDGMSAYEHATGGSTRRNDDGLILDILFDEEPLYLGLGRVRSLPLGGRFGGAAHGGGQGQPLGPPGQRFVPAIGTWYLAGTQRAAFQINPSSGECGIKLAHKCRFAIYYNPTLILAHIGRTKQNKNNHRPEELNGPGVIWLSCLLSPVRYRRSA